MQKKPGLRGGSGRERNYRGGGKPEKQGEADTLKKAQGQSFGERKYLLTPSCKNEITRKEGKRAKRSEKEIRKEQEKKKRFLLNKNALKEGLIKGLWGKNKRGTMGGRKKRGGEDHHKRKGCYQFGSRTRKSENCQGTKKVGPVEKIGKDAETVGNEGQETGEKREGTKKGCGEVSGKVVGRNLLISGGVSASKRLQPRHRRRKGFGRHGRGKWRDAMKPMLFKGRRKTKKEGLHTRTAGRKRGDQYWLGGEGFVKILVRKGWRGAVESRNKTLAKRLSNRART